MVQMTTTRRAFLLGTGAAVGGVLAASCSPQELLSGGQVPLAQRNPTRLEFWGGPNSEQRKGQVAAWNVKYPNLTVNFQTVDAVGAGVEALRAYAAHVAAGTAPQVVDFDRFQVAAYVNWRMFGAVDGFAKRDKYDLSGFVPATIGEATGLDKRLYGLPSSVDSRLLYWNKQLFAEAGLDPERAPATWDEMRAYAAKLTRRETNVERLGFHTEEGQATLHTFAWQNGGDFLSPDGKTATLAQPQNVEALEWMVTIMREQAEAPQAKSFRARMSQEPGRHPFFTGQLAMQYQINNWAGEMLARHQPEMAFGVAQPPVKKAGDKPLTWSGGYSYLISHNVRGQDIAWELIKWLVSEEGWNVAYETEMARAKAAGGVYVPGMTGQPALDKKLIAKFKTGLPALDRVPEIAVDLMQHTRYRNPCIAAADLWEGITRAQEEAVYQQHSAKAALEEHNGRVQRALDQAWVFAPGR